MSYYLKWEKKWRSSTSGNHITLFNDWCKEGRFETLSSCIMWVTKGIACLAWWFKQDARLRGFATMCTRLRSISTTPPSYASYKRYVFEIRKRSYFFKTTASASSFIIIFYIFSRLQELISSFLSLMFLKIALSSNISKFSPNIGEKSKRYWSVWTTLSHYGYYGWYLTITPVARKRYRSIAL